MLSKKLGLSQIAQYVKGKRVLFRADFNVPLKGGVIANNTRIVSTLPSIEFLLQNGAHSITLLSHLGRPAGQRNSEMSLSPVASELEQLLKRKVTFVEECRGETVERQCREAGKGDILLLQNLRFHAAEEGKGVINGKKVKAEQADIDDFRSSLSRMGEVFVNDAFGTAHRAHSSMVGIDQEVKAAGFLMKKELDYFAKVLESPQRPLVVFMGGAKVHDKLPLLENLLEIADEIIIGGAIAFTFLKVQGNVEIANSRFDQEGAKLVPQIMKKAQEKGVKIHLPLDIVSGNEVSPNAEVRYSSIEEGVPAGFMGLDVGAKTLQEAAKVIARASTMFWNGPYGVFEIEKFAGGSRGVLEQVIAATQRGMVSVAGGGDTLNMCNLVKDGAQKLSHVSTGGGASLELMEGKQLPGVLALSDASILQNI